MHISQLTISGIKALDRTIELAPLTLVAGPNASGKTAILESIRFALLGYCPGMSKTNAGIFDLASDNRMQVRLQMSDGTICTRGLSVGPKGGITADPCTDTADLVTPCLDPELYFGMSEKDRVQYIFEHCQVAGDLSGAGIAAKVANAVPTPEPVTEDFLKAKAWVIERVQLKATFGTDGGVQEALEEVSSDLRELFKESNAAAKDSQGAVSTLTELRLTSAQVFVTVPDLEKQKAEAQTKIEDLQKKAGTMAAQNEEAERVERQRWQIEQALAVPGIGEADIQTSREVATAAVNVATKAQDARSTAEAALKMLEKVDVTTPGVVVSDMNQMLAEARAEHRQADEELKAAQADRAELDELTACPHCKSKGKGWKANLDASVSERLRAAQERHIVALNTESQLIASLKDASDKLDLAKAAHAKNVEVEQAFVRAHEVWIRAQSEADQATERLTNMSQRIEAQTTVRANYQKQLDQLATVQRPSAEEMSRLSGDLALLRVRVADLNVKLDTANRTKFDLQRAEQAAQLHKQHAAKRDVLKAAGTAVVKLKADLVTEAFTTLLERANSVTGDLLKTPLAYHPERNELGRWEGHVFVTHRTFSGTEKALAYIGLSVALAWESPFRIVLLDEASRMTGEKATIVLQRLLELVENDVIHQAIVVEPSDIPDAPCGWHLVSTAAEQPAIA